MVRQRPHWLLAFTVPLSRSCLRHASAHDRLTSTGPGTGSGLVRSGGGAGIRFNRLHGPGNPGPEADGEHYTSSRWPATRNRRNFCPGGRISRLRPPRSGEPDPSPAALAHLEEHAVELRRRVRGVRLAYDVPIDLHGT